jgi:hypothetical protein
MAAKKKVKHKMQKVQASPTPVFEIVVILAIVAIVAVTGQVLIHYDQVARTTSSGDDGSGLTGFAVADEAGMQNAAPEYVDIGITKVEVNPESPLIGEPFEVKATLLNQGKTAITTPFYVGFEFIPMNDESGTLKPLQVSSIMTKSLEPGETGEISIYVTTIMPEGILRIVATADSTVKLDDKNPANNQMSKTIVVAAN